MGLCRSGAGALRSTACRQSLTFQQVNSCFSCTPCIAISACRPPPKGHTLSAWPMRQTQPPCPNWDTQMIHSRTSQCRRATGQPQRQRSSGCADHGPMCSMPYTLPTYRTPLQTIEVQTQGQSQEPCTFRQTAPSRAPLARAMRGRALPVITHHTRAAAAQRAACRFAPATACTASAHNTGTGAACSAALQPKPLSQAPASPHTPGLTWPKLSRAGGLAAQAAPRPGLARASSAATDAG